MGAEVGCVDFGELHKLVKELEALPELPPSPTRETAEWRLYDLRGKIAAVKAELHVRELRKSLAYRQQEDPNAWVKNITYANVEESQLREYLSWLTQIEDTATRMVAAGRDEKEVMEVLRWDQHFFSFDAKPFSYDGAGSDGTLLGMTGNKVLEQSFASIFGPKVTDAKRKERRRVIRNRVLVGVGTVLALVGVGLLSFFAG